MSYAPNPPDSDRFEQFAESLRDEILLLIRAEFQKLRVEVVRQGAGGLLNLQQAALVLGCDPRTVKRYVKAKKLKSTKLGTGKKGAIRFAPKELERFIDDRTQ